MPVSRSDLEITLTVLRQRGVSLWSCPIDPTKLEVMGKLSATEIEWLRQNKIGILTYLRRRNTELLSSDEVCRAWREKHANTGSCTP